MPLDPTGDLVTLLGALVDIPSESLAETRIADEIEASLAGAAHLTVERDGNSIVARTQLDRDERVLICGHVDTVRPRTTCRTTWTWSMVRSASSVWSGACGSMTAGSPGSPSTDCRYQTLMRPATRR